MAKVYFGQFFEKIVGKPIQEVGSLLKVKWLNSEILSWV